MIMTTTRKLLITLSAMMAMSGAVQAQSFGIGTAGGGSSTYSIGAAIANVISKATGDQYLVQPYGGTGRVMPLVNSGRTDFGLANILEVSNAFHGKGDFAGHSHENLRVVAVLYPFDVGLFVRDDAPFQSINDIKGARISSGYSGQRIIGELIDAALANADLSMDDMDAVPTTNLLSNADDFTAGRTDIGFFALGSGKLNEVDASVGGIRFIPFNIDAQAQVRMQELMPQTYVRVVRPGDNLTGLDQPMPMMAYDYILYAGKHVSDEAVRRLVHGIVENRQALAENYANLGRLDPKKMAKNLGIPYHPGAIRYYKENGLWSR
ncbi:TAXI family TRAP transporter solute-binding subunit [Alloalcanivorax sp. C16-2]|uniref:TAXI family TRAP transporter solute-binding subunit n=1 Tax=Alloalcanivorax sp. C16-2 TaxID=3390052 RepID=UPI003970D804